MSCDINPKLTGWALAQEMARPDAPLDRLGELCGYDLAWVMAHRADVPLDRIGELRGRSLSLVLSLRPDAGGIQHPNIGVYRVWEWRDTLTIGCATHSIAHWREHVEGIAALHNETKCVPAIRDLLTCISSADGGAS